MRSIGFFLSFIFILSKSFGAETMELPLLKKLVEISSGSIKCGLCSGIMERVSVRFSRIISVY